MFDAYKIGVEINLTDNVSATLSALMQNLSKTEEATGSLQKQLEGIVESFKSSKEIAEAFKIVIDEAQQFESVLLRIKDIGGMDAPGTGLSRNSKHTHDSASLPTKVAAASARRRKSAGGRSPMENADDADGIQTVISGIVAALNSGLGSAVLDLLNSAGSKGSGAHHGKRSQKKRGAGTAHSTDTGQSKEDLIGLVLSTGMPLIQQYLGQQSKKGSKGRGGGMLSLLEQVLSNRADGDPITLSASQLPNMLKKHSTANGSKGSRKSKNASAGASAKSQGLHANYDVALKDIASERLPDVIKHMKQFAGELKIFGEHAAKNPAKVRNVVKSVSSLTDAVMGLGKSGSVVKSVQDVVQSSGELGKALTELAGKGGKSGMFSMLGKIARPLTMVGKLNPVVDAVTTGWDAGQAIGNFLNDHVLSDKTKDQIGKNITLLLASFGNKEAKEAAIANGDWHEDGHVPSKNATATKQPIVINMDGKKVADGVMTHMNKSASRPPTGSRNADVHLSKPPVSSGT